MLRYKAAALITVNKSIYRDHTPEQVLAWHADQGAWWSSSRHDESLHNDQVVFVRFAGTNEIIGRARVANHVGEDAPNPHDPDLPWRYEFEFLNREPVRGVYLRDFGVTGGRARHGLIGLRHGEAQQIGVAIDGRLAEGEDPPAQTESPDP
jgi:hypothetical protein